MYGIVCLICSEKLIGDLRMGDFGVYRVDMDAF